MAQMRFDGQGHSMYLEWPVALTACQHLTRLTLEGCTYLPTEIGNLVSTTTSAFVLCLWISCQHSSTRVRAGDVYFMQVVLSSLCQTCVACKSEFH